MTSERKIAANRANARASTGPRTTRGKSVAAQNARRHGLSLSGPDNPTDAAKAEKLAHQIAGKGASHQIFELARRIADAEIGLLRARQARHKFFAAHFSAQEMGISSLDSKCAEKLAVSDLSAKLRLIDRYERRALSRRKFAIRDFDAARRETLVP
jgi:hypothetical protein